MNIPTPDTLRATLKRRSAKHGNAALARSIGIAPDKLWNFSSGRTFELKHRDLVAVLRHLNINPPATDE
jgi:lambda repressor-like predicted transcriptional regulator